MRRLGAILCLCLFANGLFAQSNKPVRLEFPSEQYSTELQCVLCDAQGLCLLYPTYEADTTIAHIAHYNTDLSLVADTFLRLPIHYIYIASAYNDGGLYVLYQEKLKKKKTPAGLLVHLDIVNHRTDTLHLRNLPTDDITRLRAYRGQLLFTCSTDKDNTNLFFMHSDQPFVQGLYLKDAPSYTIDDFWVDTLGQRIVTCANLSSSTKDNVIWVCESDLEGNVLRIVDMPDTGAYRFQNARITQVDTSRMLIAGTYQLRKGNQGNTATGVYSVLYENGAFSEVELQPYDPVTKSQSEILYLPGRLFRDSTHVAFVTESFYPEYRYSTTYSYGVPTTEPIFMGYRFLNAEVHIFDKEGHLAGKYSFPFDNMLVTNLTSHLRVAFTKAGILFYHLQSEYLVTMLTDRELNVIDPIRSSALFPQQNKENPVVYTTALWPWYEDYYLLSGYRFRNTGSTKTRRPVYFINKLRYQ